jgi:hypothetical protein
MGERGVERKKRDRRKERKKEEIGIATEARRNA